MKKSTQLKILLLASLLSCACSPDRPEPARTPMARPSQAVIASAQPTTVFQPSPSPVVTPMPQQQVQQGPSGLEIGMGVAGGMIVGGIANRILFGKSKRSSSNRWSTRRRR